MIHSSLGKNVFAPLSVNTFNMNIDELCEAKTKNLKQTNTKNQNHIFFYGKGFKLNLGQRWFQDIISLILES